MKEKKIRKNKMMGTKFADVNINRQKDKQSGRIALLSEMYRKERGGGGMALKEQ